MQRLTFLAGLWLAFGLGIGCTGEQHSEQPVLVRQLNIGGATFIYPMMDKWSFEYEKARRVKVNYNAIGSGSGIQQMVAGTLDFCCSDMPMNDQHLASARAANGDVVHIPLAMGAVVPAYNLPGINKPVNFTGPILADIYLGKITHWNDAALKEVNKGVDLPDKKIAVGRRSDGSGTTYIWTDYLSRVSPAWKEKVGSGTSVKFPVGVGSKGSDDMPGLVKQTDGSIGYLELIYALGNNIQFGAVRNRQGQFIHANLASVTAAAASAVNDIPEDLRYSLANAPGEDAYPICGTNWAIVYVNQPASKKQPIVDFLTWVTHDGQERCAKLHYARLPAGLVRRLEKRLDDLKVAN